MQDQTLNSSFTKDAEEVLRQLEEALVNAQFPENSWAQLYASDALFSLGGALNALTILTAHLKHYEKTGEYR